MSCWTLRDGTVLNVRNIVAVTPVTNMEQHPIDNGGLRYGGRISLIDPGYTVTTVDGTKHRAGFRSTEDVEASRADLISLMDADT